MLFALSMCVGVICENKSVGVRNFKPYYHLLLMAQAIQGKEMYGNFACSIISIIKQKVFYLLKPKGCKKHEKRRSHLEFLEYIFNRNQ